MTEMLLVKNFFPAVNFAKKKETFKGSCFMLLQYLRTCIFNSPSVQKFINQSNPCPRKLKLGKSKCKITKSESLTQFPKSCSK